MRSDQIKGEATMMRALVAQGGGPTAVINQSLAGVVLEARRFSNIESVYGACHGVAGILSENLVDLGQETTQQLELVAATPGSALGSTRDKPDIKYCQEILRVLQAHGTSDFFYIGGNDTADTLRIVSEEASKAGYPLRCIHVPKTIDNDLMCNDHTLCHPSVRRCQPRQRSPARCLPRGCHGQTRRLLDRGLGNGEKVPR
jgi:6-phosphofructokinase